GMASRPASDPALEPPVAAISDDAYAVLGSVYDDWCSSVTEDIDFYVDLARAEGGPVLEVGVGSGRIAIPTAQAGVPVVGGGRAPAVVGPGWAEGRAVGGRVGVVGAGLGALPGVGRFSVVAGPVRGVLPPRGGGERVAVVESLRRRLVAGGLVCFDVVPPGR